MCTGGPQSPNMDKGYGVSEQVIGRWLQRTGHPDDIVLQREQRRLAWRRVGHPLHHLLVREDGGALAGVGDVAGDVAAGERPSRRAQLEVAADVIRMGVRDQDSLDVGRLETGFFDRVEDTFRSRWNGGGRHGNFVSTIARSPVPARPVFCP